VADDAISVVPANQASWRDLQAVFGTRGTAAACQCQRIKLGDRAWWYLPVEARAQLLRDETDAGRTEDKADDGVWTLTCFAGRAGFRRRGVTYSFSEASRPSSRRAVMRVAF
jgi:hypothetical protein